MRNHWGRKRLDKFIRERLFVGAEVTEEMISRFAQDVVHGGYEERSAASKLTGEWIVFARHEGANHYLTLGRHDEGDDATAARVRAGAAEFPHLPALCP